MVTTWNTIACAVRGSLLLTLALMLPTAVGQPLADHTYSSATIATGARVYVRTCALCHGPDGGWVEDINLGLGRFRTAVTDADLRRVITGGTAEGRMPGFPLAEDDMAGIIAYIRTGFDPEGKSIVIGNVANGKRLFAGKGACSSCHRVGGVGPRSAPDLSDIGVTRTPAALQRTLIDPAASLWPINRPVTIVTRDERTITGRRLNEDTYSVQVLGSDERLYSLMKSDLVRFEISEVPTHQPTTLSADEVANLLGYLLSLRGEL
jgi:putative heme-binding domain-containing protein